MAKKEKSMEEQLNEDKQQELAEAAAVEEEKLEFYKTSQFKSVKEFVQKYCRWADYYYGQTVLALLEKKNYDCILWDNGCTAYQARPIQCSTYPFWSWMIKDKQTWDECAQECPGMNQGKLWSYEEILQNKNSYDENTPLTKEEVEAMY